MKTVTLQLVISLIMESVKAETYIKGRIDKSVDDKAAALAYNEEAGDETFHERKLFRTMHTSLSRLKAKIGDYIATAQNGEADNIFSSVAEDNDTITITLNVSDRFNEAFAEPLAKLCSKYIEDYMLFLWWGTFNVKQAEFYRTIAEVDMQDILSCFAKTSPYIPETNYTSTITLTDPPFIETQLGSTIRVKTGESFTVTYQTDDSCVDDVMARSDSPYVQPGQKRGKSFTLKAVSPGVSVVTLFSRHDEDIRKDISIIVS